MTAHSQTLLQEGNKAWQRILDAAEPGLVELLSDYARQQPLDEQLFTVLSCSTFVADTLARQPGLLLDLLDSGDLHRSLAQPELRARLQLQLNTDSNELEVTLRRFRRREIVRIVWRDFCRLADTRETIRDTSLLAEACIGEALRVLSEQLEQRFGVPTSAASGERQSLIVIAMGKLGARELNLSSDIDLIFAYPESGQTEGGTKVLSNEQFFIRLGQALIASLDKITAEGFVFRVDMRLRPYGESGALVHNFSALEEYYQDQGRDWERYALIKANVVTGEPDRAQQLADMLRPFIYRRYIDFGAIESLRSMKQMITREVRRRGLQRDVKLGRGGIREIEFIAQCFQLIRGGRDLGLQQRELLLVLDECRQLGCLPEAAVEELKAAYLFLRDSEHAIQGYADKQTQLLPEAALECAAMARVMGYDNWELYCEALEVHRARVQSHFDSLIAAPQESDEQTESELELWGENPDKAALQSIGFEDSEGVAQSLRTLFDSPRVLALQAQGKDRLDEFMPLMLTAASAADKPDLALQRLLPLVQSVLRRSAYLALLIENPSALSELVSLCASSPWIADLMARHPVLLDELLDRSSLYRVSDPAMLKEELRQQVTRLPTDDLEAQMDALRYFKASQVLRVAACELFGQLPLKRVSDYLTWIAEAILQQVLAVAWMDLTGRYGQPARDTTDTGFAILGYGKLGGIELGYGSDLDLVFVYDAKAQGVTDGEKSIDNAVFYTRLGQRIIHMLDARMSMGQLYEVDMRLRPSGNSGMLVVSLQAFGNYQLESAWTWEHQALVRARFIAGDVDLAQRVELIRQQVLCTERDTVALRQEVLAMRQKMRDNLLPAASATEPVFDLKQSPGGIVDIEFLVQFAVLAWSHGCEALARWSDNVRILETLAKQGYFETAESDALTEAYLAYRSIAHQLALQQESAQLADTELGELNQYRAAVTRLWEQWMLVE